MNQFPHVNWNITVSILPPSAETISSVVMKVERLVNEFITTAPNAEPTFNFSYHSCPPQQFTFDITSTTSPSQIFQILRTQLEISPKSSLSLASEIYGKAIDMNLGHLIMNVFVEISYDPVLGMGGLDLLSSVVGERLEKEDNEDLVDNLVRDCVIKSDELGLENESCSVCLQNLLENSKKHPTRIPCHRVFY